MRSSYPLLSGLCLVIIFFATNPTVTAQASLFSFETYTNANGETLKYRKLVSDYDSNSKYPLIIFLHGSGERGNDNQAQLKWGVLNFASDEIMKNYKPIVIAPQCPMNEQWANFVNNELKIASEPSPSGALVLELIDQLLTELPVDPNRVYITGLSMGGFGTFDLLARKPELFAAAVPVCGGGDPNTVEKFAKVPVWVFHGATDTTVPVKLSRDMVTALQELAANPGFTIYPDTGHFSWIAAYSDLQMMHWLFQQRR